MSLLFKHVRIYQVFGANTNVGKTILTTALVRASLSRKNLVSYLKPVSTGSLDDADDMHVQRFSGFSQGLLTTKCLYRYNDPVSPHLAAMNEAAAVPADDTFVNCIASYIRDCVVGTEQKMHMYVETAGGVHSPTLSGTTQVDAYRPLLLPTILIGDSKLGGISSTIAAYESLMLRGYTVDSVLLFRDDYYRNWEYLSSYFGDREILVSSITPPPERIKDDPVLDNSLTEQYYQSITSDLNDGVVNEVVKHLDDCHSCRIAELDTMARRTLDSVWWPFVQHGLVHNVQDVSVIDSAWGDFFSVYDNRVSPPTTKITTVEPVQRESSTSSLLGPQFDGSASWWTQTFGHSHPSLALAAAKAAGRYGHVMFPQAAHLPALKLAEKLLRDGPGKNWASRVFFSDDGSTGMEVALKMALRTFTIRRRQRAGTVATNPEEKLSIIGLKGSYHGDTIGAMDACAADGVYTCEWHDAKGYWLDPPTVSIRNGEPLIQLPDAIAEATTKTLRADSLSWAYDVSTRLHTSLAGIYRRYISQTLDTFQRSDTFTPAALVLEPLVMGAGGMIFVDPLFQRILIDVVRDHRSSESSEQKGLPVIFDEVFVGLYRIGMLSCAPLLGVTPDISVYAKTLTGGIVPMAVTLASDFIFESFKSDSKADALLHGHSYTAHAVGCEVAHESLLMMEKLAASESWKEAREKWNIAGDDGVKDGVWSFWDPSFVLAISQLDAVKEVMTLGTVFVLKLHDENSGYQSHSAQQALTAIKEAVDKQTLSVAPGGASFGIHFRTLGNVAYFMSSLNTPAGVLRSVENRIWDALR